MTDLHLISIISPLIGVASLALGVRKHIGRKHWISKATQLKGKVTLLEKDHDNTFRPHISVTLPSEVIETFRGEVASKPASYSVGDEVDVLYSEFNQPKLLIRSFRELWFTVALCYFFAFFGFLTPLILPWLTPPNIQ